MAKVIDVSLQKSKAMYGRDGRYTYILSLDDGNPYVFTAYLAKSLCGTYWDLAIFNRSVEQVYQFTFERKRDCLTFIKRDFDSAEYTREAFVDSQRHQSW